MNALGHAFILRESVYFDAVSEEFGIANLVAQKSLAELFATISRTSTAQCKQNCPTQEKLFPENFKVSQRYSLCKRRGNSFRSSSLLRNGTKGWASCDSLPNKSCRHGRAINGLTCVAPDNKIAASLQIEWEGNHTESSGCSSNFNRGKISNTSAFSVNYLKALRVDCDVCKMAIDGKPYTIKAWMNCQLCGRPRLEKKYHYLRRRCSFLHSRSMQNALQRVYLFEYSLCCWNYCWGKTALYCPGRGHSQRNACLSRTGTNSKL